MYCYGSRAVKDGIPHRMKALLCMREWILEEGWEIDITKRFISYIFLSHVAVVMLVTHTRQVV